LRGGVMQDELGLYDEEPKGEAVKITCHCTESVVFEVHIEDGWFVLMCVHCGLKERLQKIPKHMH